MKKQIIVEKSVVLSRIALLIDGECKQFYVDQTFNPTGQSKVIQGQIEKVAPHLKAAFVNFGEEKNGLLHLTKIPTCYNKRVQQGLRLPVQVTKENTGDKGHKLSAFINIPGYYLVCLPFEDTINISRKITDPKQRMELKAMIESIREEGFGFIIRTNSVEASEEVLRTEAKHLMARAKKLMQYKDTMARGTVLLEDQSLALQLLREWVSPQDEVVLISNDMQVLEELETHLRDYLPQVEVTTKAYPYTENLFGVYGIEKPFEQALRRKVWLKNGGNLVIESTEAMTVVDVNSAKAIEKKNQEQSIKEINEFAIRETLKQMVYRNIAGIVILDLIDIKTRELKEKLYAFAKEEAQRIDGARTKVFPISELDLLQMSREKKYPKLSDVLLRGCQSCGNLAAKPNAYLTTFEIEQKIKHVVSQTTQQEIYLNIDRFLAAFWREHDLVSRYQKVYGLTIHLEDSGESEKYAFNYHI
ncbi:MAG: ribonuclease E/G [Cellulosilyticaceae bacterium]